MPSPSASPSLELVHATASVYKRFESWLKRACKNYGDLLDWKAIVDNVLRRERVKDPELDVEQRAKVTDAIEEYDKLNDALLKLAKYKAFETFGWTGENFIKWVGDETVSVGYSGLRERSSQYWLSDILLTPELPLEKKARDVLGFYGVERLALLRIPSQVEAVRELVDFLENVKKWPRDRLTWVVEKVYPLSDLSGGFWTVSRKVVALESLRDAWEDIVDGWEHMVMEKLKLTPQFEVLKTVLTTEWEAERYLRREVFEKAKADFLERYGESVKDPAVLDSEFLSMARSILNQRAPEAAKISEVYEEIKPLVPADKVELTRAGLQKAIRWAFLHPAVELDAFASSWVFPLGFTTEEARAIASKILEKVVKAPPPVAPPPPVLVPPVKPVLTDEEKTMLNMFFLDKLKGAGVAEPEKYKAEFEKALDVSKNYEFNLAVARDVADDIIERVRPIAKMIEVHVKVKVSEGEDLGTYVAMLMYDTFEVTFLGLTSTPALKTFLESGEEWVDFTEQYRMAGFEEEEMMTHLAELPYPFSTGARIRVYWKYPEDVEFTEKAKEGWDTYYRVYSREALEALTVPVLTDIAKIKQVKVPKTKAELVDSIMGLPPPPPLPPALAPPPPPPPKPPEKGFREFPDEVDKFRDGLVSEAEDIFRAYGIFEHWVKMRDSVVAMIDEVIRKYWHLPTVEAMRVIRKDFMTRIHEEFVKKLRPPPPPKPPPPEVAPPVLKPPYPYIPPAIEYVELEADFQTFLKEVGISMDEYRRLEAIGKFTMREEYRRWKAKPYSS